MELELTILRSTPPTEPARFPSLISFNTLFSKEVPDSHFVIFNFSIVLLGPIQAQVSELQAETLGQV